MAALDPEPLQPCRDEILGRDARCVSCGYDLRTLRVDGRCPECGTEVRRSVRGDSLEYGDPQWVGRLARGVRMMHVGFRALIGGLVFAPVGLLVLGLMSVFPSRAVLMFLGYAWLLATAGVFLVGAWLFTTPDPRGTPGSSVEKVRTGCRTAVGMVALLAALSWGSGLWPRWVYGVILVATVLGLAALIYLLLIHVVHLADRLERQPPWRQRRFLRLKKSDVRIQDTCRMGQRIALLAALVGIITVIARATGPFSAVPFATSSLATIFFLLLLGLASVLWDLLAHCREAFRDATAQAELNWLRVTGEIEVEREAP